jgi:voltage-gated potassium channel
MKDGNIKSAFLYRKDALSRWLLRRTTGRTLLLNLIMIFFLSSLLIFFLEKGRNPEIKNYGDALWLMIVTMTTVGYGDVVPITVAGRIVTIIAMVLGIGTLSVYITTRAAKKAQKERRRFRGLSSNLKFKNHVVVCGWNPRGSYVISRLHEELKGQRIAIILLCDLDESPIDDDAIYFFKGSPNSESTLRMVNITEAKAVILLADDSRGGCDTDIDARTVLAALTIRSLNSKVEMTAEVLNPENTHHLELAGVGEILDSDMVLGNLLARSALRYGLINIVSELVTRESGTNVHAIKADENTTGMSQDEIAAYLEEKFSARLLMITSEKGVRPVDPSYRLTKDDVLIVFSQEGPKPSMAQGDFQ